MRSMHKKCGNVSRTSHAFLIQLLYDVMPKKEKKKVYTNKKTINTSHCSLATVENQVTIILF